MRAKTAKSYYELYLVISPCRRARVQGGSAKRSRVETESLAGHSCAKKRSSLKLTPQAWFAPPGPWSVDQALCVENLLQLAQLEAYLAPQSPQGSCFTAMYCLGGSEPL